MLTLPTATVKKAAVLSYCQLTHIAHYGHAQPDE